MPDMSPITTPNGVTVKPPQENRAEEKIAIYKLVEANSILKSSVMQLKTSLDLKKMQDEKILKDQKQEKKENDKKKKDEEKTKKDDKKGQESLLSGFNNTNRLLQTNWDTFKTTTREAIEAPFKVYTQPLKEILGIDIFGLFGSIRKDLQEKKKMKGKKNPSDADVMKTGEQGTNTLYITKTLKEIFGKEDKNSLGKKGLGLLGGAGLGAVLSKFLKGAGLALGIGTIASGVIWTIIDGVKGFFKSDEWGASKLSSTIGSLIGGTKSGWEGAFSNMGKMALSGFGTGWLVGGPLGGLVGGIIGAVIGGVTGYIGGENFAKSLDSFGKNTKLFLGLGDEESLYKEVEQKRLEKEELNKILKDLSTKDYFKYLFTGKLPESNILSTKKSESLIKEDNKDVLSTKKPESLIKEKKQGFWGNLFNKDKEDISVQDAIITKTGQVIETSPDDNIIATKNDPASIFSIDKTKNNKDDKLLDAVNKLVDILDIIKDKGFGNNTVINNRPLLDLADLKGF